MPAAGQEIGAANTVRSVSRLRDLINRANHAADMSENLAGRLDILIERLAAEPRAVDTSGNPEKDSIRPGLQGLEDQINKTIHCQDNISDKIGRLEELVGL